MWKLASMGIIGLENRATLKNRESSILLASAIRKKEKGKNTLKKSKIKYTSHLAGCVNAGCKGCPQVAWTYGKKRKKK